MKSKIVVEYKGHLNQALEWYRKSDYYALFIFCSSLDPQDREITKLVASNKEYIDSLTGEHILYLFFNISEDGDNVDTNSTNMVHFLEDIKKLYHDDSHSFNIRITHEICKHYGIDQDLLPALILVKGDDEVEIFPTENYSVIETYLYAAHFVSAFYDFYRNNDDHMEFNNRLAVFAKKMNEKLSVNPDRVKMLLDLFKTKSFENKTQDVFCNVLTGILRAVGESKVLLNKKLQQLKDKIKDNAYDIFISCKSEDYNDALELFYFLEKNGKKPFLADPSMRHFKYDEYGDVIRGVIDICDTMIVYTTNPAYPDTTYVHYEWTIFSNDINTGKKQGKLLVAIPSYFTSTNLPIGLRHVEAFRVHSDEERMLEYINGDVNSQDELQNVSLLSTTDCSHLKKDNKGNWLTKALSHFLGES